MISFPASEVRVTDALKILKMYENSGHLVLDQVNLESETIVVSVMSWFGTEPTAGGAAEMNFSIGELHDIAPTVTEQAIIYASLLDFAYIGDSLYTPWSVAVDVLDQYDISIRGMKLRHHRL